MLKVAMLSGWHVHAKGYANAVNSFPDAKVTAVWDEEPARGKAWAAELKAPFEADLKKCVARDDVEGVVVDAPTSMHPEVMIAAARAGKHIFTEKVMALTVRECGRISAAVRKAGVKFCISMPQRCSATSLFANRILVLRPGALGDAIVTLPVLQSLSATGARVTVVGHPVFRLAVECGLAADFIPFDDARLLPLFAERGKCDLLAGHRTAVAYTRYDDPLLAENLARNGADQVVPWPAHPAPKLHITDHLLEALRPAEIEPAARQPSLRPQGAWITSARSWLRERMLSGAFVAIHPGSGGRAKRWPAERFAELARALACPVVWLLGPAEEDDAEARRLGEQAGVIARNLPLATLAGLLAVCRAYVGNDSGVSHLAAAVGAPTIALFGPTDPAVWAPRGERVATLGGPYAGGFAAISVERVLRELQPWLTP